MSIIIPGIIALILIVAAAKKVDILSAFSEGVKNGLSTVLSILPILILVLTAIEMLKASHLLELAVSWIAPMTEKIGIPSEILPLALLKPFSGSGSLAMLENIVSGYGAESRIAILAAVLSASSETTIYTISVYLGKLTDQVGKILFCALLCDAATVFIACRVTSFFF